MHEYEQQGDVLRSTAYSVIINYFALHARQTKRLPTAFLRDLETFVQDAECRRIFKSFLRSKGYDELTRLTSSVVNQDLGDSMNLEQDTELLQELFRQFRQTKSFKHLRGELHIAEDVEALSFQTR